jgi:hypothetical protein
VTDESSDIQRNHIVSMSMNSRPLSFSYKAEDLETRRIDADGLDRSCPYLGNISLMY